MTCGRTSGYGFAPLFAPLPLQRAMLMRSRLRRIACLGLIAGLVAGPAFAADTANGSKNFRAPPSVPNFFSNEAGPMLGPAVETQRGVIYSGQPVAAIRDPTGITAARARQHIA